MAHITLHCGELWHTPRAPHAWRPDPDAFEALPEGALAVDDRGTIVAVGAAKSLAAKFRDATRINHAGVIAPGFVDAHLHFPQTDIIGCHGEQLLGWLEKHTYPAESRVVTNTNPDLLSGMAERFVTELLANGTTAAVAYAASSEQSAAALFKECDRRGMRAVIGKVSMDRESPAALCQDAVTDQAANERLIEEWHGRNERLYVALTPRFAVSCSPGLLQSLGDLYKACPTLFVQTHYAESVGELAAVKRLFPDARDYLSVYERFGLIGERTLLGHGIHVAAGERERLRQKQVRLVHCPTSNLFLGSGLMPITDYVDWGIPLALGTDVGAGTSFSMVATMRAAYGVQQLRGWSLSPAYLLYLATLAGADALGMGNRFGSFAAGKQADFQVIDERKSRLLSVRAGAPALDRLFAWITLGDDRLVERVYVDGRRVWGSSPAEA